MKTIRIIITLSMIFNFFLTSSVAQELGILPVIPGNEPSYKNREEALQKDQSKNESSKSRNSVNSSYMKINRQRRLLKVKRNQQDKETVNRIKQNINIRSLKTMPEDISSITREILNNSENSSQIKSFMSAATASSRQNRSSIQEFVKSEFDVADDKIDLLTSQLSKGNISKDNQAISMNVMLSLAVRKYDNKRRTSENIEMVADKNTVLGSDIKVEISNDLKGEKLQKAALLFDSKTSILKGAIIEEGSEITTYIYNNEEWQNIAETQVVSSVTDGDKQYKDAFKTIRINETFYQEGDNKGLLSGYVEEIRDESENLIERKTVFDIEYDNGMLVSLREIENQYDNNEVVQIKESIRTFNEEGRMIQDEKTISDNDGRTIIIENITREYEIYQEDRNAGLVKGYIEIRINDNEREKITVSDIQYEGDQIKSLTETKEIFYYNDYIQTSVSHKIFENGRVVQETTQIFDADGKIISVSEIVNQDFNNTSVTEDVASIVEGTSLLSMNVLQFIPQESNLYSSLNPFRMVRISETFYQEGDNKGLLSGYVEERCDAVGNIFERIVVSDIEYDINGFLTSKTTTRFVRDMESGELIIQYIPNSAEQALANIAQVLQVDIEELDIANLVRRETPDNRFYQYTYQKSDTEDIIIRGEVKNGRVEFKEIKVVESRYADNGLLEREETTIFEFNEEVGEWRVTEVIVSENIHDQVEQALSNIAEALRMDIDKLDAEKLIRTYTLDTSFYQYSYQLSDNEVVEIYGVVENGRVEFKEIKAVESSYANNGLLDIERTITFEFSEDENKWLVTKLNETQYDHHPAELALSVISAALNIENLESENLIRRETPESSYYEYSYQESEDKVITIRGEVKNGFIEFQDIQVVEITYHDDGLLNSKHTISFEFNTEEHKWLATQSRETVYEHNPVAYVLAETSRILNISLDNINLEQFLKIEGEGFNYRYITDEGSIVTIHAINNNGMLKFVSASIMTEYRDETGWLNATKTIEFKFDELIENDNKWVAFSGVKKVFPTAQEVTLNEIAIVLGVSPDTLNPENLIKDENSGNIYSFIYKLNENDKLLIKGDIIDGSMIFNSIERITIQNFYIFEITSSTNYYRENSEWLESYPMIINIQFKRQFLFWWLSNMYGPEAI